MKKLISLVLCLIMILSVMPTVVFAAVTEYTSDELAALNLSVPLISYYSDTALATKVAIDSRLDTAPKKYLFKTADTADTKEYILLKSVNAGENDGYFVMVNTYTDSCAATAYNTTAGKYVFDTSDTASAAYKMNQTSYINQHFPLMKDYINTHTWYTEPGVGKAYSFSSKISLPSVTEYAQNADRIGVVLSAGAQWWTRTPHNTMTRVWQFLATSKKIDAGSEVTSTYPARYNRPCFYLSEDFFKNVKIDESYLTDDALVTEIIKAYDLATLKEIGYSDSLLVKWGILKGSTTIKSDSLKILGDTQVGCKLSAVYELEDGFEQEEYTEIFWEYSENMLDGYQIVDNEDKKYIESVPSYLNECYVRFKVQLGNIDGMGDLYISEPVYIKTLPPVIDNVKISGDAYTKSDLTASFDTISGAPDLDKCIVNWYWLDDVDQEPNLIGEDLGFTYNVDDEYANKYITCSVKPANTYEIYGEEVFSKDYLYIIASVPEDELETKLVRVDSTATITGMGKAMLDTVSPSEYTFKIDRNVKTKDGVSDSKEYILLKNVNAKEDDGYFVMLSDGALATNANGSAVKALSTTYPGEYIGEDASLIAKNYEMPTRMFNKENKKSIAYYLNDENYIKTQFPIMYEGDYINDHTWYTEAGISTKGEKAYASDAKIALISITEYIENIERIGAKVASVNWEPTLFQTRTPHPTVETSQHTSGTYTVPTIWHIRSSQTIAGEGVVYLWQTLERPVFYLSEDFFKNVKVTANENSVIADVLKELMSYEEMLDLGYTKEELTKMGISESYPIANNPSVKGNFFVGNTIWADYEYSHTTEGVKEGNTKYQWYVGDGNSYEKIDGATNWQYVIKQSDIGKKFKVEITPVDENGSMAKKIFAESHAKASDKNILTFTNPSIGNIENMSNVTKVTASVEIEATQSKNVKLYVGVYNKKTNRCVSLSDPLDILLEVGKDPYMVSTKSFTASEDNYIKVFVLDTNKRPVFGIEYFN